MTEETEKFWYCRICGTMNSPQFSDKAKRREHELTHPKKGKDATYVVDHGDD